MTCEAFAVGRRRHVWGVWIVKVEPREERALASTILGSSCRGTARAEPFQRRIDDFVGMTLGTGLAGNALVELFVEGIEALIEAERRGDGVRADKRRGMVPLSFQQRGDCRILRAEVEHHVAANAVHRRVVAGEESRVGETPRLDVRLCPGLPSPCRPQVMEPLPGAVPFLVSCRVILTHAPI